MRAVLLRRDGREKDRSAKDTGITGQKYFHGSADWTWTRAE